MDFFVSFLTIMTPQGGKTYQGSALWIIDPNGSVVGASNPTIPASVGSFYFSTIGGKPIFPFERSNTAMYPQAERQHDGPILLRVRGTPVTGSVVVWRLDL